MNKKTVILGLLLASVLVSTPVLADVVKAAGAGTKAAELEVPKPAPVSKCNWPASIPLEFSVGQLQVLGAWATDQDYSHAGWQSIAGTITPQFAALTAKYCHSKAE